MQQSASHPSPALSSLCPPPNPQFGRKRFYSSINDINGKIEYAQATTSAFEETGSSKSTAFSNFAFDINTALPQSTVQKKREQQVLDRISKIWNEMAILNQGVVQQQSSTDTAAQQKGVSRLNISKELSVENPRDVGSLFMNHAQTRRN